ncbi:MAG TPA: hypothetical protein VH107_18870, partial [Lacipirellulaceae bacterium]|nr:hypothetical protein [Lacipirellulaceae bacterium]
SLTWILFLAIRRETQPPSARTWHEKFKWKAEDRRKSSEAGFDGHLVKLVEHGTLTAMLKDMLDKKG